MRDDLGTADSAILRRLTEIEYVNWCGGLALPSGQSSPIDTTTG
jgi:hypothetical protein